MDNGAKGFQRNVTSAGQEPTVKLSQTGWGYIVRPGETALIRAAYGEMIATFAAVLLVMAAYGVWLLPNANGAAELLPFRIAGTVIFFVLGGMLWLIAHRGLCHEIHVDLERRALRIARRNRRGREILVGQVPIDDVESVFLQRAKGGFRRNRLCVRIAGDRELIEVAVGCERDLAPILQRMTHDLRKQEAAAIPQPRPNPGTKAKVRSAFAAR